MKLVYFLLFILVVPSLSFSNEAKVPLVTDIIRVNIGSDEELKETLTNITDEKTAISIFDRIGEAKIEIRLLNDYDFKDQNSPNVSELNDDIGKTHGTKITVYKNIAPIDNEKDKYYLSISYDTTLYTNSDQPEAFQNDYRDVIYWNEKDNHYLADVYFKEENVFKFLISKIKSQDAFYWSAGAGFHEINADDADRGILLSSITQQAWFHGTINDVNGPTYREYNYMPQDASEQGVLIEGEVGRDFTMYKSKSNRIFTRAGVNSRLTTIKDASYVGTYIQIGNDYTPSKDSFFPAIRILTGLEAKRHVSDNYAEGYIEVGVQGEYIGTKFRYTMPFTNDPGYLNPLPNDFENRGNLNPAKEPTIWFVIEGRIP